MSYEAVIGLEVHCRLQTRTKIFCGCPAAFGNPPNTQTCPVCLGMPGALPSVSAHAVTLALKAAVALHCRVRTCSRFARKSYLYPDLPKGYQITQFDLPIAEGGYLETGGCEAPGLRRVGITRIHLEEDAGKLLHELDGACRDSSYVDFNRSGVPLIEIVSEPEIRTPHEAGEYLRSLRAIVQYLAVSDGNMEQGGFRCDANISLRRAGSGVLGHRVELKNLNSFRHVCRGLDHEIERQTRVLEEGGEVVQETRLWNEAAGETCPMRGKEEDPDYRYFDDPDLPALVIDERLLQDVRRDIPELPRERLARFTGSYGLPEYDAGILVADRCLADYFEQAVAAHNNPKAISNWIMTEVLRYLKDTDDCAGFGVTPGRLGELVALVDAGAISGKIAKSVFKDMCENGRDPALIIAEKGLKQISDEYEIECIINCIMNNNNKKVELYRSGKAGVLGYFVGQVMHATGGKANPSVVNILVRRKLEGNH